MIRCIAIDDQQASLEALESYIKDYSDLHLIDSYTNPLIALKQISCSTQVDLIFMDIDMPQISGLELAKALRGKAKKIVFTTSHVNYAYEAYEAEGDAFLLKPYSYSKFALAINRLFSVSEVIKPASIQENFFFVKNKEKEHKAVFIKYTDIIAFESFHNYCKIHTKQETIIAYLSLKDVKEQLTLDENFVQMHRAFIISKIEIKHIEGMRITMNNGIHLNVGDSYKNDFKEYLTNKIVISSRRR